MQLFVQSYVGKRITTVSVKGSDTIAHVKQTIQEKCGILIESVLYEYVALDLYQIMLTDDQERTLQSFMIKDGDVVTLIRQGDMQIYITTTTPSVDTIDMRVDADDSVESVIWRVQFQMPRVTGGRLMRGDEQLEGDRTLSSYNIQPESTLHLVG